MKKWIIILFFTVSFGAFSQELMMPELIEKDTIPAGVDQNLIYNQPLSGSFKTTGLMVPFQLPGLDFDAGISGRWNFKPSEIFLGNIQWRNSIGSFGNIVFAPYLSNAEVFSSSALKMNDRLTLGGYSFGARSVFTAPFPARGINNFDVRGSSFFMQYKVSKNFKIETRVNVTQGPGPGF